MDPLWVPSEAQSVGVSPELTGARGSYKVCREVGPLVDYLKDRLGSCRVGRMRSSGKTFWALELGSGVNTLMSQSVSASRDHPRSRELTGDIGRNGEFGAPEASRFSTVSP